MPDRRSALHAKLSNLSAQLSNLATWLGDADFLADVEGPRGEPWAPQELAESLGCALVACCWRSSDWEATPRLGPWLTASAAQELQLPLRAALAIAGRLPSPSRAAPGGPLADALAASTAGRQIRDGLLDAAADAADRFAAERRDLTAFYEAFVAAQRPRRRRHGIYYTPPALADFVVRQADEMLVGMGLPDGLADESPWEQAFDGAAPSPAGNVPAVQILDPAAGDGAFVCSVIRRVHDRWQAERSPRRSWQETADRLLLRLHANELLAPPALLGQFHVAWTLLETGCRPPRPRPDASHAREPSAFRWTIGNALRPEPASAWACPTVVLGNPPYRSSAPMDGGWIEQLLRGRMADGSPAPADSAVAVNYHEVNGQPLGERKVWLQDDYVRFLRWAQWKIDSVGWGVISLVLNHGLLDNVTFRGVREKLRQSFQRIDVADLHGNVKAREACPDGGRDENVFAIATGVAAMTLGKSEADVSKVRRVDLWGSREDKIMQLQRWSDRERLPPPWREVDCLPPEHRFVKRPPAPDRRFSAGPLLTELMPLHTTAPVTARDHVVIDTSVERLCDRLARLGDLSIPDEVLREECFARSRSTRYPRGDTRGWRLPEARAKLAELRDAGELKKHVRRCLYRPFDWRHVFWTSWMIDWPRSRVTRHFDGENLALIARRQMLPGRPCNYFWATSTIALDGVIRSDNRGSESLFPLWIYDADGRRPNLSADHAAAICSAAGLTYEAEAVQVTDGGRRVGALALFAYAYGLFQSPSYQERFADELRRSFPRVMLPQSRDLFWALAASGRRLLELHATPINQPLASASPGAADLPTTDVAWGDGRLAIPTACWEFTVGGYCPVAKWLKSRRGDAASDQLRRELQELLGRIRETQRLQSATEFPS